jgi:hypothetical protein
MAGVQFAYPTVTVNTMGGAASLPDGALERRGQAGAGRAPR